MNSEKVNPVNLTYYPLNLTDKIVFRRKDKYIDLSNLSICYTWKNKKNHIRIINLKFQHRHGIKNLNCLMDHVLYSR